MDAVAYPPQLLENVEETLSCAAFEEDSLYRKLNCEWATVDTRMIQFKAV